MLLWNYRGYYNSTGNPKKEAIMRDCQKVYSFLRSRIGAKGLVGVHGESLGGYFASHLAKSRQLDFLFIDRSF